MVRILHALILIFGVLLLGGCTAEDPHPEARDPIYLDLSKKAEDHKKLEDESKVRLAELYESLEKAEPNSIIQKDIRRDIAKTQKTLLNSQQMAKYFRIRADRRAAMDKIESKQAKARGEDWPKSGEYSEYLTNQRLQGVNRNWNSRVPKLQDRILNVRKPAVTEDSAPKSGH
ncbi:MAG: hypothetical protein AB7F86_07010 [Bdellovibrionales bacterium]